MNNALITKHSALAFIDKLQLENQYAFDQKSINKLIRYLTLGDDEKCNIVLKNLHYAIMCDAMFQICDEITYTNDYKTMIDIADDVMQYPLNFVEINETLKHHFDKMSMFYYENYINVCHDYDLKFYVNVNTGMITENIATYITHNM